MSVGLWVSPEPSGSTIGLSGISAPSDGVAFSLDAPAGVGLWIRYDADVSDGAVDLLGPAAGKTEWPPFSQI